MHPSGCACAAAGSLIAAIGYDGLQVAGGMGAVAPHVGAMVAFRPFISRGLMVTPTPRFLRALLTGFYLPRAGFVRVLCNNPDKLPWMAETHYPDTLREPAPCLLADRTAPAGKLFRTVAMGLRAVA